jgi:hypothetical protein
MARWTGIVLALPSSRPDGMASRLPAYLHPTAGRPLVWHAAASFAEAATPPTRVLVISEGDLSAELFHDLPLPVEVLAVPEAEVRQRKNAQPLEPGEEVCLVVHAAAVVPSPSLNALLDAPPGSWVAGGPTQAAAFRSDPDHLAQILRLPDPWDVPHGSLAISDCLPDHFSASVVQDRAQLAAATDRIRRHLIRNLMSSGVSFLLPDTVVVDVDVRVGRDSIIYPGVVLEGTTMVGEETVIGPGCRIIDSWVGSGVELRGWNYISHTSIRNRAILEPYVRRGFD